MSHKVFLIDSPVAPQEVFVINSSSDVAHKDSPVHAKKRFSLVFDDFRSKWFSGPIAQLELDETPRYTCEFSQDFSNVADLTGASNTRSSVKKAKEKKKKARQPKMLNRNELRARKPRNKAEAMEDLECVIDKGIEPDLSLLKVNWVSGSQLFAPYNVIFWKYIVSAEITPWIAAVYKCDDHLIADPSSVINLFIQKTFAYPKRFLVLTNWKVFLSSHNSKVQRSFRAALKEQRRFSGSSYLNLEEWLKAFFFCCMERRVHLIVLEDKELPRWIDKVSKAIAWDPYKKNLDVGFSLEAGGGKRGGKNLQETYRRVLECVPRISPQIIDAIVRQYPSVKCLYESFKRHGSGLLSDVKVNEQRTVGPVMSEKLFVLFTSRDLKSITVR